MRMELKELNEHKCLLNHFVENETERKEEVNCVMIFAKLFET